MTELYGNLEQLAGLARERSSTRRRELLRRMTGLFAAAPEAYGNREAEQFGDILAMLAREMEMEVRRTLAERLANIPKAPRSLMIQLANDQIEVAEPVLASSLALTDGDLVALARLQSQAHLKVIATRRVVSQTVADALILHGQDEVLATLAANDGAELSRGALEVMVDRARCADVLHEPLINRAGLPIDLLNALFFSVSSSLKRVIARRMSEIDPGDVDQAIRDTERRLRQRAVARDSQQLDVDAYVAKLARSGPVTESLLVSLVKQRRYAETAMVFAKLAGIDLATARRVLNDTNAEALSIACRACRFDRQTFATLAVERPDDQRPGEEVRDLIELYHRVPVEAAERVMRFWRLRVHAAIGMAA